jgi:hypothetical protein
VCLGPFLCVCVTMPGWERWVGVLGGVGGVRAAGAGVCVCVSSGSGYIVSLVWVWGASASRVVEVAEGNTHDCDQLATGSCERSRTMPLISVVLLYFDIDVIASNSITLSSLSALSGRCQRPSCF